MLEKTTQEKGKFAFARETLGGEASSIGVQPINKTALGL
jgi:hypothetical protein